MWLYEQDRLAFVAVNDAACALYGWSRDELALDAGRRPVVSAR